MTEQRKHILIVSVPAYGHMIPLLELAKKIAQHHQVTFAVSEFKMEEIGQRDLLVGTTFPVISIPDGYFEREDEKILSVSVFNRMQSLVIPGAQKLFEAIPVKGDTSTTIDALGISTPVDVVIADNMLAVALSVLPKRNVQFYFFNTAASSMTLGSFSINADTPTKQDDNPEELPFVEVPEPGQAPPPISPIMKELFLPIHEATHLVTGIIANSVYELEAPIVDIIRTHPEMKGKPFRCVGPLFPDDKISVMHTEQREKVKNWLNGKAPRSVVYVSLGSVAVPKPDDIQEITKALLAIGKPFIFSLQKREHFRLSEEISAKIPTQLEDSESRFLILDWAPQKLILQHKSTAVFLSHCGWNSTIESIASGVPVVAWPMFADQKLNALELVQKGTAFLMEGTGMVSKKVISAEEIEAAICKTAGFGALIDEKSTYRTNADQWKITLDAAMGPNGSSQKDFLDLMNFNDP